VIVKPVRVAASVTWCCLLLLVQVTVASLVFAADGSGAYEAIVRLELADVHGPSATFWTRA
jgi:hypothetical protein